MRIGPNFRPVTNIVRSLLHDRFLFHRWNSDFPPNKVIRINAMQPFDRLLRPLSVDALKFLLIAEKNA